jgi:hypothetical protein
MTTIKITLHALAIACLAFAPAAGAQTMFKCKAANGTTSFQQAPCDGTRSGEITVEPGNVVEGTPDGDRKTRIHASRSLDMRIADEKRAANEAARPPNWQPCYSEQQMQNAETSAASVTASPKIRAELAAKARSMRNCYR